jgi:hypothetical protein
MKRPSVFQLVALSAIVLVVLRMFFPHLVFDSTSLILFAIAAIALLLPTLLSLLPPLKKLKYGDFEAEFNEAIKRLEQRVGEAEQAPAPEPPKQQTGGHPPMRGRYVKGFKDILAAPGSNTEKILAAGILCEGMLSETARDLELTKGSQPRTPKAIVQALASHGFVSQAEQQAFDEFWKIRNAVVHGQGPPPNDEQTARLLDLLWRLVRTLA